MKDALTIEELKALCEHFFNAGVNKESQRMMSPAGREARGLKIANDFEREFDNLMDGKYKKAIEQEAFSELWDRMQQEIEKRMEDFDRESKLKAHQAAEDLRKIIFTC